MPESSYDCIVIGSGPGGYVAAIRAAQLGMKTAIVEKDKLGGRCLNYACIPAKAVLRAADVFSEVKDAGEFGIQLNGAEPTIDFEATSKHRDKVVETLTGGVGSLMKGNKIDVIEGFGALTSDGNVRVGDDEIEAGSVILATGSVAKPLLGLEFGERVLDTERAWALRELPKKMAVIGAGASGAEIASAYGRLGTEVTLLEALPQILPLEDEEIAKAAAREIRKQNVKIVTDADVESASVSEDGVELKYGNGETERFDYLAIAAGRGPDVEGLGLDDAGVKTGENGRIEVDGRMRTSIEGVYAIGDIVHGPALAHKASDEGVIAVEDAAGMETHPLDYDAIPAATFCHPQVASFGLTEKQARDAGYDVVVGKVPMGAVGAPTVYGDRTGMIKIVGDKKYGEILGAHMAGARATDLISELVAVHDLEGGFAEVARIVHPHPTFSEATMEAARATDGWLIHG
ncbi:MAG: dihydrolipoyl dehydrogenase [Actinomycetota bacterium]|jgi:dihydrolipoamide dehydrogenase|nr:dihydrolipoyl dehydrogenase [Actinomycetota bacterium]